MATRTTKRALWLGAALAVATVLVVACPPLVVEPYHGFSYASRVAPRVFVEHRPLRPEPGKPVTLTVVPEVPADAAVSKAFAMLRQDDGEPVERECAAAPDGGFACIFDLGSSAGTAIYGGRVELADGTRVATRTNYLFSIGSGLDEAALIPVRVPVKRVERLLDAYRIDTVLVRDPRVGYDAVQFMTDAEQTLLDGILADPVYRWRDDQLGFFVYTRPGRTTSYYSGWDTRCGQNPWPAEATLPAALAQMEVIAVLHRQAADASAAEGRAPEGPMATAFRDCAGRAVRPSSAGGVPDVATFSAAGGLAESPAIATHEFGHAVFGLGDEYHESDETRRVDPAPSLQIADECCCRNEGGAVTPVPGGSTGGSVVPKPAFGGLDSVVCLGPGAKIVPGIGTGASLPACTNTGADFAPSCGASPQGGCPKLSGTCVEARTWLGAAPPAGASAARPNVFETEADCQSARAAAEAHPGVERPLAALGACRKLCGATGDAPPCPCMQGEAWIVDHDPGSPAAPRDDLMAAPEAQRLGGTCAWCVDTSLCVRWQRALGDGADAAWSTCSAPPRSATGLERMLDALLECVGALIEALQRHVRFGTGT